MDIVEMFAYPLPVTVIAELLGVPAEDRDRFKRWSDTLVEAASTDEDTVEFTERQRATQMEMATYFFEMIEDRREEPQDDLMTVSAHPWLGLRLQSPLKNSSTEPRLSNWSIPNYNRSGAHSSTASNRCLSGTRLVIDLLVLGSEQSTWPENAVSLEIVEVTAVEITVIEVTIIEATAEITIEISQNIFYGIDTRVHSVSHRFDRLNCDSKVVR